MEGGGATSGRIAIMNGRSTPSAGRCDGPGLVEKKMERKRMLDIRDRECVESQIETMEMKEEEDGIKRMPPSAVVKYHDLLEKSWGWDRLLPWEGMSWSDYSKYLEEYYRRNAEEYYHRNGGQLVPGAAAATGSRIAALADICLKKEEQLASEWKIRMKSKVDVMLPSKTIILSCLIHERAHSVTFKAGGNFSDVFSAALLCISKEADLTRELLRRGASPSDDYLIYQSSEIRMCSLSLMNCTSCLSVAASAAMLGAAKEAERMLQWMSENNMLLDIEDDDIPLDLNHTRLIRIRTLYAMIDIMLKSSFAASGNKIDKEESASINGHGGDGNGIAAAEAANITGGGIPDVLNPQVQKKMKDSKKKKEDFVEKLWGWERLVPFSGSTEWSDYCNYLEEYYRRNALKFVAEAAPSQNPDWLLDPAASQNPDWLLGPAARYVIADVVKSCLEMEEELMSEWKTHVKHWPDKLLPVNNFIQSSIIKDCALSLCSTGDKFSVPSIIAFVCITKEADLMRELLKRGAKPTDDMIQQSSVIRMCALGLVNLKTASAAAMLGIAKEAKMMCDWMKRENRLVAFSMSAPSDLEVRLIRIRTLDFMISILQDSSFPSSKML
ncbi:hypothetical protein BDA96_10G258900 [Sorghum bicolor]|uniref:Uncharacterized protein n=1 Tax=Sorghum bicolor TaxID=4558 RepID=A0A921Q432_SORBI|nr:hypothetical protein BDA96_10G258900 [Sorghum bicolor]